MMSEKVKNNLQRQNLDILIMLQITAPLINQ